MNFISQRDHLYSLSVDGTPTRHNSEAVGIFYQDFQGGMLIDVKFSETQTAEEFAFMMNEWFQSVPLKRSLLVATGSDNSPTIKKALSIFIGNEQILSVSCLGHGMDLVFKQIMRCLPKAEKALHGIHKFFFGSGLTHSRRVRAACAGLNLAGLDSLTTRWGERIDAAEALFTDTTFHDLCHFLETEDSTSAEGKAHKLLSLLCQEEVQDELEILASFSSFRKFVTELQGFHGLAPKSIKSLKQYVKWCGRPCLKSQNNPQPRKSIQFQSRDSCEKSQKKIYKLAN